MYCSIENTTGLNHTKFSKCKLLPFRRKILCLVFSFLLLLGSNKSNAQIVINELGIGASSGDAGGGGEFIELYNKSGCTINIGCYVIVYSGPSGAGWSVTIPPGTTLNSGQYYLIGGHSSNLLFSPNWTSVAPGTTTTWINNWGTNGKGVADLDLEKAYTSGKGMIIGNLPNTGGQISLFKPDGAVVSSVSYNTGNNSGSYAAIPNTSSGCSLTSIPNPGNAPNNYNDGNNFSSYRAGLYLDVNGNYQLSVNDPAPGYYPTPGKANSTNGISTQMAAASLPLANVGNNNSVCIGSSVILGATAVPGNSYSWSSSLTGFTGTSSTISVSPTSNTTYTSIHCSCCSNSCSVIYNYRIT